MPDNVPLNVWNGSIATEQLENTIKAFNAAADKQTKTMVRLSWAMLWLTVVMAVAVGVQIWLTLKDMTWL